MHRLQQPYCIAPKINWLLPYFQIYTWIKAQFYLRDLALSKDVGKLQFRPPFLALKKKNSQIHSNCKREDHFGPRSYLKYATPFFLCTSLLFHGLFFCLLFSAKHCRSFHGFTRFSYFVQMHGLD